MFETTIAGSLPKPCWLAETNKLWPQWRAEGAELAEAKRDATLLWLKEQEDAGIDIVTDGEQSRQHFVHGFLESVEGIDFEHKVEDGHPQQPLQRDGAGGGRRRCALKGRVHQTEARIARAHTKKKLKFTMPGPMTIVDTIADRHYGDRVKLAMAFAELLNQEARALRGGRRGRDPVRRAGVQRLHERRAGLGHRGAGARGQGPDVHDRRAHLLRLRHQGQPRLEADPRRRVAPVRGDLPGAGEEHGSSRCRSSASTRKVPPS